ncbi:MAG: (deoxy)nucleoside triphosphate pyrophosphohydrolase [Devosiaceae bacterium]|nr:(deoxy)nucleoside triphosphate pyrophosphohydrolase [Devosiaceae bacterium]
MKNLVIVVACALIDRDRRVLIARRKMGGLNGGLWEFPGGKIEIGETPEEAIIRELKEELNVETQSACLAPLSFVSHAYDNFHLLMPLYVCRKWQGEPEALEHIELKWVRANRLRGYDMIKADIPLIAHLCDLL